MSTKLNYKKVLILEPHIDDMELGCSVLLEFLNIDTEIEIITFCYGSGVDNGQLRQKKRDSNLQLWRDNGFTVTNKLISNGINKIKDSELKMHMINDYCGQVISLTNYNMSSYDLILIPQKDLHNDHRIVNEVGLILTRSSGENIWEYLIMNSFPEDFNENYIPKYNTQFSISFGQYVDPEKVDRVIGVCEYTTEKSCKGKSLRRQKYRGEYYLRDRFNIIKQNIV